DQNGHFEVPALCAGMVIVMAHTPTASKYRVQPPGETELKPSQRLDLKLELLRGVRANGRVIEKGAGTPIPNVTVTFYCKMFHESATTDAAGHYSVVLIPGRLDANADAPKTFLRSFNLFGRGLDIEKAETDKTLPDIELIRSVELRGKVLDDDGKP